ncbi:hypothetical protein KO488_08270 [Poseidonibacter lekithochrous]|uniref:hypothetical protein n=1 Tax=Poseidonibacter TaxID=2321187 RepID=UPI001C086EA3|nr:MULTISPECIES: hypothetical protein [Poseidonibacter]MBU3014749.1 hypothetical protein [Poseidonibacter lekithochrous]MDO6828047.1 hypothetical protein [Poseidonibacter sp. 1_MG-2023]
MILKFIIKFIVTLLLFPISWLFLGLYSYVRLLFTFDTLNISFTKNYEVYEHDFKD